MHLRSLLFRCLCAVLLVGGVWTAEHARQTSTSGPVRAAWPQAAQGLDFSSLQFVGKGEIPMPPDTRAAHASNLLVMPASSATALTVFWFAGDRESAPNVQIAASQWDRKTQAWSAARFVVNRHAMGELLGYGLRRLGNPVAWLDGQGRMHLFVVATGWGGWAASRILHLRQSSSGQNLQELAFEPMGVLPLSWLWNTSFLVRNAPLPLQDGGMLLPVHFELGLKYASALRFDRDGTMVGMQRVSNQWDRLQPTLVMQSPEHWLALMRVQRPKGKIAVAASTDAGAHWSDQADLALDNPDSALAGLGLVPGQMLLAFNPSTSGRTSLALGHSTDGKTWKQLAMLEQGADPDEYSYPSLAWVDGHLWVSYTVDRQRIAWQRFGPAAAGVKP
jgi:predicted neuraminidase